MTDNDSKREIRVLISFKKDIYGGFDLYNMQGYDFDTYSSKVAAKGIGLKLGSYVLKIIDNGIVSLKKIKKQEALNILEQINQKVRS